MSFSQRLEHLMQRDGITKYRISKTVGCSATTVANWLSGTAPTGEYLQKLSEMFNVSIDYLLGKTEEKEKPAAKNDGASDDDIKFALFGGAPVTDAQFEEVKRFAKYIADQNIRARDD